MFYISSTIPLNTQASLRSLFAGGWQRGTCVLRGIVLCVLAKSGQDSCPKKDKNKGYKIKKV